MFIPLKSEHLSKINIFFWSPGCSALPGFTVYVHAYVEVCHIHVFFAGTMCGHCLTLCSRGAGMGIKLHEMCGAVRVRVEHELVWVPAGTCNKYTAGVG